MLTVQVRQAPSGNFITLQIPNQASEIANDSAVLGGTGSVADALNALLNGESVPLSIARQVSNATFFDAGEIDILGAAYVPLQQNGLTAFQATMPAPSPNKLYVLEAEFDVRYYGGALGGPGEIDAKISKALDGSTFTDWALMGYYGVENATDLGWLHVHMQTPPTLGSDLGVIVGTPSLTINVAALASVGVLGQAKVVSTKTGANNVGSCLLKITEYVPALIV